MRREELEEDKHKHTEDRVILDRGHLEMMSEEEKVGPNYEEDRKNLNVYGTP